MFSEKQNQSVSFHKELNSHTRSQIKICWIFIWVILLINPGISDRVPNSFIPKIYELYKDIASLYGSDFKIKFERINQIGASWYNYAIPNYWVYNYVRFD